MGQRASSGLGFFGGRGFQGDDQLAGVGEMLLVDFEALGDGESGGKHIENLRIKVQPDDAQRQGNKAEPPEPGSGGI